MYFTSTSYVLSGSYLVWIDLYIPRYEVGRVSLVCITRVPLPILSELGAEMAGALGLARLGKAYNYVESTSYIGTYLPNPVNGGKIPFR